MGALPAIPGDLYRRLRAVAAAFMGRERTDHTLQPTALVHEALLRMGPEPLASLRPTRAVSMAAVAMRHVLIDSARRRGASKRSAAGVRVPLEQMSATASCHVDPAELEAALRRLEDEHDRLAAVVRLRFHRGLPVETVADELGVTTRTVQRDWRFARLWLLRELGGDRADA